MGILQDKYALTAVAAILIISMICLTDAVPKPSSDTEVTGIVSDIKKTDSGYTFTLTDGTGKATRCFYSEAVPDRGLCTVSGRFSDDGTILFVSRLSLG